MRVFLMEFLGGAAIVLLVLWLLWKNGFSKMLSVKYWIKKQQIEEVNTLAKDARNYDQERFKKNKDAVEKVLSDEEDTNPNTTKKEETDGQSESK